MRFDAQTWREIFTRRPRQWKNSKVIKFSRDCLHEARRYRLRSLESDIDPDFGKVGLRGVG
jgi:hypothetical protein